MKPGIWPVLMLWWLPVVQAQTDTPPAPAYPPLEQFDSLLERPLFNATRRPEADQEEDTISESAAEIREKWRLSGVVWEGEHRLALFSERQGEGRLRIRSGMYLDGNWQLDTITEDSVTLNDNGQTLQLELWEPREPSTRPLPESPAADGEQQQDTQNGNDDNGPGPETEQGSNGESS